MGSQKNFFFSTLFLPTHNIDRMTTNTQTQSRLYAHACSARISLEEKVAKLEQELANQHKINFDQNEYIQEIKEDVKNSQLKAYNELKEESERFFAVNKDNIHKISKYQSLFDSLEGFSGVSNDIGDCEDYITDLNDYIDEWEIEKEDLEDNLQTTEDELEVLKHTLTAAAHFDMEIKKVPELVNIVEDTTTSKRRLARNILVRIGRFSGTDELWEQRYMRNNRTELTLTFQILGWEISKEVIAEYDNMVMTKEIEHPSKQRIIEWATLWLGDTPNCMSFADILFHHT